MELLNERFSFAILKGCNLDDFISVIQKRRKDYFEKGIAIMQYTDLDITQYFNPPYENHLEKFSFWENYDYPNCVFFSSNYEDGYGFFCGNIRKELQCELIECRISMNLSASSYPMNSFKYTSKEGKERVILSYFEGSWVFYEDGDVLPIENPAYYIRRYKKDRMNYNVIVEYLMKMGFDIKGIDTNYSKCMTFERICWD